MVRRSRLPHRVITENMIRRMKLLIAEDIVKNRVEIGQKMGMHPNSIYRMEKDETFTFTHMIPPFLPLALVALGTLVLLIVILVQRSHFKKRIRWMEDQVNVWKGDSETKAEILGHKIKEISLLKRLLCKAYPIFNTFKDDPEEIERRVSLLEKPKKRKKAKTV